MVMRRETVPPPGYFDKSSRIDELLANHVAIQEELLAFLKGAPWGDKKRALESLQTIPYQKFTYALGAARTDQLIEVPGVGLLATSDGVVTGCEVRLNNKNNPPIGFTDMNPIPFSFSKIYLTTPVQLGKTLTLYVGTEDIPWASALPSTIQASVAFNMLRSDKDTEFTGALVQGAKEDENLTGLLADKIRIVGITLQADQRLHYKLLLWFSDTFEDVNLDLDMFCGEIDVDMPAYGIQIGGAGQWYLDVRDLHLDYEDQDLTKELHISLYNADPTAKIAGALGEVVAVITYEMRT